MSKQLVSAIITHNASNVAKSIKKVNADSTDLGVKDFFE